MAKIIKFEDFKRKEEQNKLQDFKRDFTKNSVDKQQYPRNTKFNYNDVTKKMDDLSVDEVDDKIEGVEESKIYESRLHRIISKYYQTFLTSFFDDNDTDRDGIDIDQQKLSDDFINDCIELFGENGSDEYNSGYSDREVKNIANQVIDEDK
jgi:hypothetical protein